MAFKIPPVYEHSTTSNISFEKGGVFTVSKPCNRQPRRSFASRGVRSGPPEVESSNMDTVPLLTPTMECELLKEPWVFPQLKTNARKKDEGAASSSTWEENFQDLSSWCMGTFQGQCDFHIGESVTLKLSGTKYEGNSVLSSEEGVLKDLMSVTDTEKWSMKMSTAGTTEHLNNNSPSLQTSSITSKYHKDDSATESNTPNAWLKLSKGSTTATVNTSSGSKQSNADVSAPLQSRYQIEDIHLNDARPISFDATENQREMWDMLQTVETTGSDTFDLLSYLCDDEMRPPEGSVSFDSSIVSKPWSPVVSPASIPQTSVKVKTEGSTIGQEYAKSRGAASTITSSSIEMPLVSTRRAERTRARVASKVEKTYSRARREKSGRKRYIEPEPEDRTFALHYRGSRDKNNEASRKSRMNKKAKENEMVTKVVELERDNRILKMKVEELEKLVTSMRSALLKSALKKET